MWSLEDIVDLLDRQQQRATYGAVAGVLGRPATFLMSGIPRSPRYSWIVNEKTLKPTGYTPEDTHPALERKKFVLLNQSELQAWLQRHGTHQPSA